LRICLYITPHTHIIQVYIHFCYKFMYVPSPLEIYSVGGYRSDCAFKDETFSVRAKWSKCFIARMSNPMKNKHSKFLFRFFYGTMFCTLAVRLTMELHNRSSCKKFGKIDYNWSKCAISSTNALNHSCYVKV